jgi:hypothetical protein
MSQVLETIERMVHGGVELMSEDRVMMAIEGIGVMCGNDQHGDITPPMEEVEAGVSDDFHHRGDVYVALYRCKFCGNECCVVLKVVD